MLEEFTQIFVWGENSSGQLGQETKDLISKPQKTCLGLKVLRVSCGSEHVGLISNYYKLYTLGNNKSGQLGTGPGVIESSEPFPVLSDKHFIQVACGDKNSGAVTQEGEVFVWGEGKYGVLGTGSFEDAYYPQLLSITGSFISIGYRHMGCLRKNLYMWGSDEVGQIGQGRNSSATPVQVELPSQAKDFKCGTFHTLVLLESGEVYSMGANTFGQLGIGNTKSSSVPLKVELPDQAVAIAASNFSACVLKDQKLYTWGNDILDPKLVSTKFKKVSLGVGFGYGLTEKGEVWSWGMEDSNEPKLQSTFSGLTIKDIECGSGFVYCLGKNSGDSQQNNASLKLQKLIEKNKNLQIEVSQATDKLHNYEREVMTTRETQLEHQHLVKRLAAQKEKLQKQNEKLKEKTNRVPLLKESIKGLEERVYQLEKSRRNIIQEEEQKDWELSLYKQKVHKLEQEVQEKTQENNSLQIKYHKLYYRTQEDHRKRDSTVEAKHAKIKDLKLQLGMLQENYNKALEEHHSAAQTKTQKITECQSRVHLLESEKATAQKRIEELETQLKEATTQVSNLEFQNSTLSEQLSNQRAHNQKLITALRSEISNRAQALVKLDPFLFNDKNE